MKSFLNSCLKWLIPMVLLSMASCKPTDDDTFGTLHGIVSDVETAEPVENASIVLNPGEMSLMSGSDGRFEFRKLEPQQYTITVKKNGYSTNRKSVTVLAGEKTEVNIVIFKKD